jgi:hypothetical protein
LCATCRAARMHARRASVHSCEPAAASSPCVAWSLCTCSLIGGGRRWRRPRSPCRCSCVGCARRWRHPRRHNLPLTQRKRARSDSASSPSADSNGSLGAPRGPPAASPPTTEAAPPAPTRPGFKASTQRPQASLPTRRTSVPRSPNTSTTQVGCQCRVLHHSRPAPQFGDQNASNGRHLPHKKSAFLHHLGGQH